jgi:hypothetical protein
MKLLRLQSDSNITQTTFTNNLAVNLTVKEGAKVALSNISVQFPEPSLIVSDDNNTFNFRTGLNIDDLDIDVVIPNGNYTITSLKETLSLLMNNNLYTYNNTALMTTDNFNFEWLVTVEGDATLGYKLSMGFNRTDPIEDLTVTDVTLAGMIVDPANPVKFFKNAADDLGKFNAELYANTLLCRGGFQCLFKVRPRVVGQTENPEDSNWMFYISKNKKTGGSTNREDIVFGMIAGFEAFDQQYWYKKGGVMVGSNVDIAVNDVVQIEKGIDGHIRYVIFEDGGATIKGSFQGDVVNSLTQKLGTADMTVFIKVGNDTGKVAFENIGYTPSPYQTVIDGILTKDVLTQEIKNNFNINASPSDVSLEFPTEGIRFFLGYRDLRYELNALSGTFEADNAISSTFFNNDLVIEILEFPIQAYDHGTRKNRPIIAVITSGEIQASVRGKGVEAFEVSYISQFPLFFSVGNPSSTLTFSSLSLRLTSQGQLLKCAGAITATILIDE